MVSMIESSSPQLTIFHLYNMQLGSKFLAMPGSKKVELQEWDPELGCQALSERHFVYLSPSQFEELPDSFKANELFVNFLRICSMSIRPEHLPQDISSQERDRHIYDSKLAFALLQKTAERGFARAQFLLGQCYYLGTCDRPRFDLAAKLFKQSAENNYVRAFVSFGYCLEQGQGLTQDLEGAATLYKKAADQQYLPGKIALARVVEKLNAQRAAAVPMPVIPMKMTPKTMAGYSPNEERHLKDFYEKKILTMQKTHEKTIQTLREQHHKEIQKLEEIIASQNKQLHKHIKTSKY
jgi:hypothetical protein